MVWEGCEVVLVDLGDDSMHPTLEIYSPHFSDEVVGVVANEQISEKISRSR